MKTVIEQVKDRLSHCQLIMAKSDDCIEFYSKENCFMTFRVWSDSFSVLTRFDDNDDFIEQDFIDFESAAICFEYSYKITSKLTDRTKAIFNWR